mgnify:CR=1 FL=1
MSELVPVLIPSEIDQLKWANVRLNCELLRQKAESLLHEADTIALRADGMLNTIHSQLANGTADLYAAKIVEGQLQFHLKQAEQDGDDNS